MHASIISRILPSMFAIPAASYRYCHFNNDNNGNNGNNNNNSNTLSNTNNRNSNTSSNTNDDIYRCCHFVRPSHRARRLALPPSGARVPFRALTFLMLVYTPVSIHIHVYTYYIMYYDITSYDIIVP